MIISRVKRVPIGMGFFFMREALAVSLKRKPPQNGAAINIKHSFSPLCTSYLNSRE